MNSMIVHTATLPPPQSSMVKQVNVSAALTGPQNVHWIKLDLHEGQYIYGFKIVSPIIQSYSVQDSVESVWININGQHLVMMGMAGQTNTQGFETSTELPVIGENPLLPSYMYNSIAHVCLCFREPPRVDYKIEYTIGYIDRLRRAVIPQYDTLTHIVTDIPGIASIFYQHGIPMIIRDH